MSLTYKDGVFDGPLAQAGEVIRQALEAECEVLKTNLVVTCTTGSHGPDDPHTKGGALDVRTRDLSEAQIWLLFLHLRDRLGPSFYVQYEVATKPNGILAQIAKVSEHATAAHLHVQLRRGIDVASWRPRGMES